MQSGDDDPHGSALTRNALGKVLAELRRIAEGNGSSDMTVPRQRLASQPQIPGLHTLSARPSPGDLTAVSEISASAGVTAVLKILSSYFE